MASMDDDIRALFGDLPRAPSRTAAPPEPPAERDMDADIEALFGGAFQVPQRAPLPPQRPADVAELPPEGQVPLPPERPGPPLPPPRPEGFNPADTRGLTLDLPPDQLSRDTQGRTSLWGTPNLTLEEGLAAQQERIVAAEAGLEAAKKQAAQVREARAAQLALPQNAVEQAISSLDRRRSPYPGADPLSNDADVQIADEAVREAHKAVHAAKTGGASRLQPWEDNARRLSDAVITGPMKMLRGATIPLDKGIHDAGVSDWLKQKADDITAWHAADSSRDNELAAQFGQGLGSSIPFVLGGVAGRVLGGTAAMTSGTLGGLQMAEEGFTQADKLGQKGWDLAKAYLISGAIGTTEGMLGLGKLADLDLVTKGAVKRYLGLILREKGEEGLQEGTQTLLSNMRDRGLFDSDKPLTEGVGQAALVGAMIGGVVAGVAGAPGFVSNLRAPGDPTQADLDQETINRATMQELSLLPPPQNIGAPSPGALPNAAAPRPNPVPAAPGPGPAQAGAGQPPGQSGVPGLPGGPRGPLPDAGGSGAPVQPQGADGGELVGPVPGELGTPPLTPDGTQTPDYLPEVEAELRVLLGAGWTLEQAEDLLDSPSELADALAEARDAGVRPFDGPLPGGSGAAPVTAGSSPYVQSSSDPLPGATQQGEAAVSPTATDPITPGSGPGTSTAGPATPPVSHETPPAPGGAVDNLGTEPVDAKADPYGRAVQLVQEKGVGSPSYVQRALAAEGVTLPHGHIQRLFELMHEAGILGPPDNQGRWPIAQTAPGGLDDTVGPSDPGASDPPTQDPFEELGDVFGAPRPGSSTAGPRGPGGGKGGKPPSAGGDVSPLQNSDTAGPRAPGTPPTDDELSTIFDDELKNAGVTRDPVSNDTTGDTSTAGPGGRKIRVRKRRPAKSFIEHIIRAGGITEDPSTRGELRARDLHNHFRPGFGRLGGKNGLALDKVRELGVDLGFLEPNATIDDALNAIETEAFPNRRRLSDDVIRGAEQENDPEQEADERETTRTALYEALASIGLSPDPVNDAEYIERAIDLMIAGESDLLVAWETAVMQTETADGDSTVTDALEEVGIDPATDEAFNPPLGDPDEKSPDAQSDEDTSDRDGVRESGGEATEPAGESPEAGERDPPNDREGPAEEPGDVGAGAGTVSEQEPVTETTSDGVPGQTVIPGTEHDPDERDKRKIKERLEGPTGGPRPSQKDADEGLFGDDHKQGDLLDTPPTPNVESEEKPEPETKPDAQPALDKDDEVVKPPRIEDAGEKIGGARKDMWGKRGMTRDDLGNMTGGERAKYTKKEFIWPRPDYEALIAGGLEPKTAHLIKQIYDRLPTAPARDDHANDYIDGLHALRALVEEIQNDEDASFLRQRAWDNLTGEQRRALSKPTRWGDYDFDAVHIGYEEKRKAAKEVEKGWPNLLPWQRLFTVTERSKNELVKGEWKRVGTEFVVQRKNGARIGTYPTLEAANAAAKEAYDKLNEDRKKGDQDPRRPHLDRVDRKGPDYRGGKDKDSKDFISDFGFRGVEFGNWVAGDERQKVVNLAYDALMDLARVMGVPPKALSLDGTLAVGFGSRGRGGKNAAAAHYEPDLLVINMTKLAGAGSLAHEFAHALDHYLGEVDSEKPYSGHPKSISRWRDTAVTTGTYAILRLPNLSARLAKASRELMQAIHFKPEDVAETEKKLETARASYERNKAYYERMAEAAKEALRKGEDKRKNNGRLTKAETQIDAWTTWFRAEERKLLASRNQVATDYYTAAKKLSGSGDYWHRPNELFARAFESWVFDKLFAEGQQSQYLVQGVEPDRFGEGFKGNPYPTGSERRVINAGFDQLIREMDVADEGGKKITGKPGDVEESTKITHQERQPTQEDEAAGVEASEKKAPHDVFLEHLADGKAIDNILAARRMMKDAGFDQDAKKTEEALEFAAVLMARRIIENGITPQTIFNELVALQDRLPKLGTRTSTSVREQAYSTPLPLAFVASQLAGINAMSEVFEPTAGNGALLIEATPEKVWANEINPARRANLEAQGFGDITSADATTIKFQNQEYDVVIANPPFGKTRNGEGQEIIYDLSAIAEGYETREVDHVISLRALQGMKADGRAVLIVGSIGPLTDRASGYRGNASMGFYKALYDRYNVVDHFTVAGKLYEKQGAAWPVDVIVIDGRSPSVRDLPAITVPSVVSSWEELKGKLNARDLGDGAPRPLEGGTGPDRGDGGHQGVPEPSGPPSEQPGRPDAGGVRDGDLGPGAGASETSGSDPVRPGRSGQPDGADRDDHPVSDDDLEKLFDDALDEQFGAPEPTEPAEGSREWFKKRVQEGLASAKALRESVENPEQKPKVQPGAAKGGSKSRTKPDNRPTKDVASSAASNALGSADAALQGLTELFGGGKTIGSGPAFDEDTYARAKPLFLKAAEKFKEFAKDVVTLMKRIMKELEDNYGWTKDVLGRAKPYMMQFIKDVRDGKIKLLEDEKPEKKKEQETETQVAYEPKSAQDPMGTLVPVNLRDPIQDSLAALEDRVGNLDDFVADQLGYTPAQLQEAFGAEQVDALALAIDNLNRGAGFIIGDQTGIGKGRVNAAIIRYAIRHNKIPVFVTEKPNLYADMYRDLQATGIQDYLNRDINILVTNGSLNMALDEDETVLIKTAATAEHDKILAAAANGRDDGPGMMVGEKMYDVVFTTYNQMQSVKGAETNRRRFLGSIASQAVLIFDESHNAGGQGPQRQKKVREDGKPVPPGRSEFSRELVGKAAGVFYSSATYAKRPEVMDLYAATDMVLAVTDVSKLAEAIARGGVPMQQAVASMLAKGGQYIRRERSFAGVTYDTPVVDVDRDLYEGVCSALSAINDFSDQVKAIIEKIKPEIIKETGGVPKGDNASSLSSITFSAVMHNVVSQMLLALKAKHAANMAIEALKRGEKPVLTVANTMETFLDDYKKSMEAEIGDAVDVDFSNVLRRYLKRVRTVLVKHPHNPKKPDRYYIPDRLIGPMALMAFQRASNLIERLDLSELAISPIDKIRGQLITEGYKVGEITGRELVIDYTGKQPTLQQRGQKERSIKGRRKAIVEFNSGKLDVMILNQAGSTGLSLHASKDFKDQSKRHMMIVQAEANIDTHMQMLGRVHRTGQVQVPTYSQLVAAIPAEKRPAAVLAKKMASLNANTTASRGGALTAKDVPDFMNEYGDLVAAQWYSDNPAYRVRLGAPLKVHPETGKVDPDNAIAKITGRIVLLSLAEQETIYDLIEDEYIALMQQLEAAGESALEAKTLDLKAKPLEVTEVLAKKEGTTSPFGAAVRIVKADVASTGKPMTPLEIMRRIRTELDISITGQYELTADNAIQAFEEFHRFGSKASAQEERRRIEVTKEYGEFLRAQLAAIPDEKPDELAAFQKRQATLSLRWRQLHELLPTGARVTLKTTAGNLPAIVLKVERKGQAANPLALGTWKVTFALLDPSRQITFSFNRLFEEGTAPEEDGLAIEVSAMQEWLESPRQTMESFAKMQTEVHSERYIVIGNILAGFEWLKMGGRIINFTDHTGAIRQGILTPRGFDLAKHAAATGTAATAEQAKHRLDNVHHRLPDDTNTIILTRLGEGRYQIRAPQGKQGRRVTQDQSLIGYTNDFFSRGGSMTADLPERFFTPVFNRLSELGYIFKMPAADISTDKAPDDTFAKASFRRSAGAAANAASDPNMDTWDMGNVKLHLAKSGPQLEEAEALFQSVQRLIDAIGPVGVRAVVANRITTDRVGIKEDYGIELDHDPDVHGFFDGNVGRNIVAVATGALAPTATAYHEIWHSVKKIVGVTPQEQTILNRDRRRLYPMIRKMMEDLGAHAWTDKELDGFIMEEIEAWAAEAWVLGHRIDNVHAGVKRFLAKIADFFAKIRNLVTGHGFRTAEDIFALFKDGEYRRRHEAQLAAAMDPGLRTRMDRVMGVKASFSRQTIDEVARRNEASNQAQGITRPARTPPTPTFTTPAVTRLDLIRTSQQDAFGRLDKIQSAIEEARGQAIPQVQDAKMAQKLMTGRRNAALEDFQRDFVKPLHKAIAREKVSRDEIGLYLIAKHAIERNSLAATRDPKLFGIDGGSGMNTDVAERYILEFRAAGKEPGLERIAQMVYAIAAFDRDNRVRAGLISPEQRQAWEDMFPGGTYVPLRGFAEDMDDDDTGRGTGRGLDLRGLEAKHITGRQSLSNNPLDSVILMTQSGIARAEKAPALKTLLRLVQANPNPDVWEVIKRPGRPLPKKRVLGKKGLVETRQDFWAPQADDVIGVKVRGKQYFIKLHDKQLAQAYKNMGADQLGKFVGMVNTFTRFYSRMQTAWNPEFFLPNIARDMQEATTTLMAVAPELVVPFQAQVWSGAAIRAATKYQMGKSAGAKWDKYIARWRRAGGEISMYDFKDLKAIQKEMQQALEELGAGRMKTLPRRTWRNTLKALDAASNILEQQTRLAVFVAAIENGYTDAKAAALSRDATIDFATRGTGSAKMNAWYGFYNVSVQGATKNVRLLRRSGKMQAAWVALAGLGFAQAMIGQLAFGDDDDAPEERPYAGIPDHERRANFIIPYGTHKDAEGNTKLSYAKIPLMFGFKIPYYIGEQAAMVMLGAQKGKTAAFNVLINALDAFNPMGQGSLITMMAPTIADPIAELTSNMNWLGRPIYPDKEMWNEGVPNASQPSARTSPIATAIADKVNRIGGGDSFTRSFEVGGFHPLDWYPGAVEYVGGWLTGGLGRTINHGIQTGKALWDGVPLEVEKIPIVRRFMGETDERSEAGRYYEMHDDVDGSKNRYRAAKKAVLANPENEEAHQALERESEKLGVSPNPGKDAEWKRSKVVPIDRADKRIKALRTEKLGLEGAGLSVLEQKLREKDIDAEIWRLQRETRQEFKERSRP